MIYVWHYKQSHSIVVTGMILSDANPTSVMCIMTSVFNIGSHLQQLC